MTTPAGPSRPPEDNVSPILIVPYMWLGDFVRAHSVVQLLKGRCPRRPVDFLTSTLAAPLLDYMPGVRQGIVWELPRGRLALAHNRALGRRLAAERYGTALVMPRTWKSALAPFLAGIPERIGFAGEGRFVLINDMRWGERRLERMIDRFGALALPRGTPPPPEWPLPRLEVPAGELAAWRERRGLAGAEALVALAPGAVGPGKKWPTVHYAGLARHLAADGRTLLVIGGPNETPLAAGIVAAGGAAVRDLTGTDLREAIVALAACRLAVSNDSGLLHIAAALGTPAIGIFGPTSPRLWAPLNPLAAILEPPAGVPCPACGRRDCPEVTHRRTDDVSVERVYDAARAALAQTSA
jgi:heptosyltransferase II